MTLYQAIVNRWVIPVIQAHEARGYAKGRAEVWVEGWVEGWIEGWAEGRAAERARWVEWNRRRMEAVAEGLAFDEAPPGAE